MKRILEGIRKFFTMSKVYVCEKCGWQTTSNKTTEKLKAHCKNCNC